jgi:hypothetical protein
MTNRVIILFSLVGNEADRIESASLHDCVSWLWYIEGLILYAVRRRWLVELMSIRQGRVSSPPVEREF